MVLSDALRLVALAACWGLAFVFVRVAVPSFGVAALVEARTAIACVVLLACARLAATPLRLRVNWPRYLVFGLFNSALPFCLIALAQTVLSASITVILVSVTPLLSALIAAIWLDESLTARKGAGLLLGVAGVTLLMGWNPLGAAAPPAWAVALALGASLSYGAASVYVKKRVADAPPLGAAAGSQLCAAIVLLPLILLFPPTIVPPAAAWASVAALAVFSSALAFLLYFRLIASIGPVKTMAVNYLSPLFGVGGGVLLLDEAITLNMVAGGAVILAGTALVLGSARAPRSTPPSRPG